MNKENNTGDLHKINHKILFLFMPESIVFHKKTKDDTEYTSELKNIYPSFYWCSAHEFCDPNLENKYLIQYQSYSIESNNIKGEKIEQIWASSKSEIRLNLISFLEKWCEHKRVLLNTNILKIKNTYSFSEKNDSFEANFLDFANFVAKSIFDFKQLYLQQAKDGDFDNLQKEFWKSTAIRYMDMLNNFLQNSKLPNKSTTVKKKCKTSKKQIKNKNETK